MLKLCAFYYLYHPAGDMTKDSVVQGIVTVTSGIPRIGGGYAGIKPNK